MFINCDYVGVKQSLQTLLITGVLVSK